MAGTFNRKTEEARTLDERVILVAYSFTANGTSNPNTVVGAIVQDKAVTRASAGKFTFQMAEVAYQNIPGPPNVSGGTTEDIYGQATIAANGLVTVQTKTGGTNTDPTAGDVVSGVIYCVTTDRTTG